MANTQRQPVAIADYNPQGSVPGSLPQVSYASGTQFGALETVSKTLAGQVNDLADELAKSEGRRAGAVAGQMPDYRPSDVPTLRGQAYDAEASKVYLSNLNAQFTSDAMDVYQKNKSDPEAFKSNYGSLVARYSSQHLWPEVQGDFTAKATSLNTTLRTSVLNNWEKDQKDTNAAAFIGNIAKADQSRQMQLAVNPNSPEVEAQLNRTLAEQLQNIDNLVANETFTAKQGEEQKLAARDANAQAIIKARANTLVNAEQVDAYRATIKKQFGAGEIGDLFNYDSVDATLSNLSKQRRAQADHDLRQFNTDLSGLLERGKNGYTVPLSEWMQAEIKAKAIGPQGQAAFESAKAKLALSADLARRSPEEADAYLRSLELTARTAPSGGTQAENYVARKMVALGWSGPAAAAIAGHGAYESKLDPTQVNPGDGADGSDSIGAFQWNSTRAQQLRAFAAARGKNWNDLDTQLEFADAELRGRIAGGDIGARNAGAKLMNARSIEEGAAAFAGFERPQGWSQDNPAGARGWSERLANARRIGSDAGVGKYAADVLSYGRTSLDAHRNLLNNDPLLAHERDGTLPGGAIVPIDPASPPENFAAQVQNRIAQADAVAAVDQRAPKYFRADERAAMKAVLDRGGDQALGLVRGIVAGAQVRAPQALNEIGGDAPEMAHLGKLQLLQGDQNFMRDVSEARAVDAGKDTGKVPKPKAGETQPLLNGVYGSAFAQMPLFHSAARATAR
jgi:hypothetical protein